MKSLTWLLESILQDCSMRCGTDTHRDFLTASRRIEHEGISFLTITLPAFAKDFEKGLEAGAVDSSFFLGFRKKGALPLFLGGLLSRVFDTSSGCLLDKPPEEVVFCIRQVCLMFKKILLPCTHQRTKEAFDGYVQCENDIRGIAFTSDYETGHSLWSASERKRRWAAIKDRNPQKQLNLIERIRRKPGYLAGSSIEDPYQAFGVVADVLWSDVLSRPTWMAEDFSNRPKHGPGATAERIRGNTKYSHKSWHTRLEPYFPFSAYGVPSLNALDEKSILDELDFVEPGAELPVRVITVPKTLKSPRIIAIEPVCMQYTQQALATSIIETLEAHPLTAGHVNFRDQSINRELALNSSKTREYGTLDLSEASDRVHKNVVERMLQAVPALRSAVFACRSTHADVPGSGTLELEKFASMGSALCFPIEAMVFYTLCIVARLRGLRHAISSRDVLNASRGVYVYGDDLIVPTDEVPAVAQTLELFGLKVNSSKTFRSSSFRESCGMDAFNGVAVTPVYIRQMPPSDRTESVSLPSFVSLGNQLYKAGFWVTARRVREYTEKLFGELPHVLETSSCLGWYSYLGTYSYTRIERTLQRPVVKGYVASPIEYRDSLTGYGALMKFFLNRGKDPLGKKELTHSVRRGAVNIKRRWVTPF